MKTRSVFSSGLKIILLLFFAVAVLFPLIRMLIFMGETDVMGFLSSPSFKTAAWHTLQVGVLTTLISLPLAYLLAWFTARTDMPLKGLWTVLLLLPMLIPSISQGSGLITLFGANGFITNLLDLSNNIYGARGIVIGEAMYVTPIVFLMFSDVLTYEDYTPHEAAAVLGIPRVNRFAAITAPFLRRAIISAAFTAFTLTVTDYGIPLTVGAKFKTLPVLMYEDVIGLLDFGKGSVIGAVLLIPAVIAFVVDLTAREQSASGFITRTFPMKNGRAVKIAASVFCGAVGIFMLLPVISFVFLMFIKNYPIDMSFTMDNITKVMSMNGGQYLLNSLLISFFVGLCGVIVAFASAYCTTRMQSPATRLLHLLSITSMAIPGLVLGLAYVLFFKTSLIYGTMIILVLVNSMHFFASPYLMMYNTLGKLNMNLEPVGRTLGVSRLRIVRDVILPQSGGTLLEAFSYFFVNSMITISAVSFLANSETKPIALLISQYEAQAFIEYSAFISMAILLCNLVLKAVIYLLKNKRLKAAA